MQNLPENTRPWPSASLRSAADRLDSRTQAQIQCVTAATQRHEECQAAAIEIYYLLKTSIDSYSRFVVFPSGLLKCDTGFRS